MDEKCITLLHDMRELYSFNKDFEDFIELKEVPADHYTNFDLLVFEKDTTNTIGSASLTLQNISGPTIYINHISRKGYSNSNNSYKGLMKHVLKFIACKALELNISVTFIAKQSLNNKLMKYYTRLGFRKRSRFLGFNDPKNDRYHTSPSSLRKIVNSLEPPYYCGFCTRRKRKTS